MLPLTFNAKIILMNPILFEPMGRQKFREYFQPSRIVLGILPIPGTRRFNVITLCFSMHSSYKPPMLAFAVYEKSFTRTLLESASECVLAIPGETLAKEVLFCGIESGREINKIEACNFRLHTSSRIKIPGIEQAKVNIQMRITQKVVSGDHLAVFGEVLEYGVNRRNQEMNLLSVGEKHDGFKIVASKGIHRIAVIA